MRTELATHRRRDRIVGLADGGDSRLYGHGAGQAEEVPRHPVWNVIPDGPFDVIYGWPQLRMQDLEMNGTNFRTAMADGDDERYGLGLNATLRHLT